MWRGISAFKGVLPYLRLRLPAATSTTRPHGCMWVRLCDLSQIQVWILAPSCWGARSTLRHQSTTCRSDMTIVTARHAAGSRLGGGGPWQAASCQAAKKEECSFKGTEGREGEGWGSRRGRRTVPRAAVDCTKNSERRRACLQLTPARIPQLHV